MSGRVLFIDDDPGLCEWVAEGMARRGYQVTWRSAAEEALTLLAAEDFDVAVTDLRMGGMNGLELCERIVANRPDIPVVVITAFGSLETAVAAIRSGAYDFVTKPFTLDVLKLTLDRAAQHRALREELTRLRRTVKEARSMGEILGSSPPMLQLFDLLAQVAPTELTVLITGESGTGKELVARALHAGSRRKGGPFVAINCAAMPDSLLESELFGHVKGAFTDARADNPGLFAQANGGTLFLDEIGELSLALQPKLLRAVQERRVRPVGSGAEVAFDARLVVATNRDLAAAIDARTFREDLYYRINVVHAEVPPLRSRGSDILLLAQHFVARHARLLDKPVTRLSAAAAEKLLAYAWPGNVRELQNAIERAVALSRFAEIVVEDLPERIRDYRRSHVLLAADDPAELVTLDEVERRYILRVVEAVGGNKSLAAQTLGLHRKTLYRKLRAYGVPGDGEGEGGE